MNKEIAAAWVAALRSGEYQQGHEQLRDNDQFCCLGVLCNLHAQAHPKIAARQHDPTMYLGQIKFLPDKVMRWAGMKSINGRYGVTKQVDTLAFDNDSGKSFKRIAKIIETYHKEL